jgi:hypothetical protein
MPERTKPSICVRTINGARQIVAICGDVGAILVDYDRQCGPLAEDAIETAFRPVALSGDAGTFDRKVAAERARFTDHFGAAQQPQPWLTA